MLRFEREVVGALVGSDDPAVRSSVEAFVDGSLRDKPEHLRLGVAGNPSSSAPTSRCIAPSGGSPATNRCARCSDPGRPGGSASSASTCGP
jgi:hypothetical protein